jgi:hypothetical protein
MKKILFLLLSTVAMYGQVPADATPLENIQITNNITDNSATKVNVQSTEGTINTISKSDLVNVVEVNDVPSLPLVGEVGKIYVVKNINKIYRWNGTFYQELAVTDISGLQAQIDLKSDKYNFINIKDLGGIGDGVFDNTTIINNSLQSQLHLPQHMTYLRLILFYKLQVNQSLMAIYQRYSHYLNNLLKPTSLNSQEKPSRKL